MADPERPRIYSRQVRELAEKLGVDLDAVEGTGLRGGVTLRDVREAAASNASSDASPAKDNDMTAQPEPASREPDAVPDESDGRANGDEAVGTPNRDERPTHARWASELTGYANRLTGAGAGTLGAIVGWYALHIEAVGAGTTTAAPRPAEIDPATVGRALTATGGWRRVEQVLEVVRNILIFVPVLIAWAHVALGGLAGVEDLRGPAGWVMGFIIALIVAHVVLGLMRQRREARADHIAREFAGTLAGAELSIAPQRATSAESAIVAFAQVGEQLTASLRGAGESLVAARGVMEQMARTVEQQGEQVGRMLSLLEPISRIGDQMGGVQAELRAVTTQLGETARTLGDIRQNLAPTSENLAGAASALGGLTGQMDTTGKQLERVGEVFGGSFESLDLTAKNVEALTQALNTVAARVLEEMDGSRAGG